MIDEHTANLERLLTIALASRDQLSQELEKTEEREHIISATYDGQQQSYRELETLYQASQARALKAEADAAALKEALIWRQTCDECGGKGSYYADDGNGDVVGETCNCYIAVDELLNQARPGASLLKELSAARDVIVTARAALMRGFITQELREAIEDYEQARTE